MTNPLKVTIISPYYLPFPGGQEVHTAFLIKYLRKHNVKITLVTSNNPKLKSYEKQGNLEIYRLKPLLEIYSNPVSLKLFKLLIKIKTDIFHVQGYWSLFSNIAAIVSKINGIPLIYTSHGFQSSLYTKSPLSRLIVFSYIKTIGRLMFKQMNLMTCNHLEDKTILEKVGVNKNKLSILPSGLDLDVYLTSEKKLTSKIIDSLKKKYKLEWPILLYVGRLVERKGCHYLLQSLPDVVKKYPKLKCIIIGDGSEEKKLKDLALKLKLENHTIFTSYLKPFSSELIFFYKIANIQILPSIAESMPISVMEGMYFGNPIMITDMHFAKWIKHNGERLYIPLNPKNTNDMSKKILNLIDNKKMREDLSKKGKLFIEENLNWKILAELTYNLYVKIINSVN